MGKGQLWVTGIGLVTPLGVGVEPTWTGLVRGDRAIRDVSLFDASSQRVGLAAEVGSLPWPGLSPGEAPAWSRTSAMALLAAQEALQNAGLDPRSAKVGLVVGSTTGGMLETELLLAALHAGTESEGSLLAMRAHPLTATADRLNERLGPFVRARTLSSACSSGANALVVAAAWLSTGELDAVVAGGSDGLCRLTLSGFNALAAVDPQPCRPFDRRRRGISLGEGAGFLVLECADLARSRGAKPIAELAGWAVGAEAYHITNPAPDGATVATLVEGALSRAGLTVSEVDYVSAHGTGTLQNDATEAAGLARAFGGDVRRIPISSSKGQIGHTLGAAGAIGAAIAALAVERSTVVPTAGLVEPDPALDLVHVLDTGRTVPRVRAALSNAFGFGGMDTVLVFAGPERAPRAHMAAIAGATNTGVVVTAAAVFGPCGLVTGERCAAFVEQRFDPSAIVDPDPYLDEARARRLNRSTRLSVVAVESALAAAGASRHGTGLILGTAYGNVDESAAFLHRVVERGPRAASPAEFPNLVPSSGVGHVSIYLGLRGPAFATADLATSGESAFVQATQLLASRDTRQMVAGAAEVKSAITNRALTGLFAHSESERTMSRCDVAAALVLEAEGDARERGAPILAFVRQTLEWRDDPRPSLAALVAPSTPNALVVLPRSNVSADELLGCTPWSRCPRVLCAPAIGESDGLGAVALAVAAERVGTARVSDALVVGVAQGRGYAIVLAGGRL